MKRLALILGLALLVGSIFRAPAHGYLPPDSGDPPARKSQPPRTADRLRESRPDFQPGSPIESRGVAPGAAVPAVGGPGLVTGRISVSRERARLDARERLREALADWLVPDVPRTWQAPTPLVEGMIREVEVKPVLRDPGSPELEDYRVMYVATLRADFTPEVREEFVVAYRREVFAHRVGLIGGILAFVLACLAILASYIRADEATRGYYTNRLRLLAAAGVGAAGVVAYKLLV